MLSLTACSGPQTLPTQYLNDCSHAEPPTERTNGAIVDYVRREQKALDVCNSDKAALRAWAGVK